MGLFNVDGVDQVASLMSCKLPFVAVTGDDHEKLEPIVTSYGFEAIRNDHPELGQGVSIAMGVRHLIEYVIHTARRYSLFSRRSTTSDECCCTRGHSCV